MKTDPHTFLRWSQQVLKKSWEIVIFVALYRSVRGEYLFLTVFAVRALVCVSWRDPCPPTAPPLPAERLEELWNFWDNVDSVCKCVCVCVCRKLTEEREVVCDSSDLSRGRLLFLQLRNTAESPLTLWSPASGKCVSFFPQKTFE